VLIAFASPGVNARTRDGRHPAAETIPAQLPAKYTLYGANFPDFFLARLNKNLSLGVSPLTVSHVANYRLDLQTHGRTYPPSEALTRAQARVEAARKIQSYLRVLLSVPFVICLVYFGSVFYNHVRVNPRGVETVQDFYQRYGNPPRVESVVISGHQYYRVTGEIPAPLGFPKGSPVYIFDSTGRLIDWTGESRNAPEFTEKWTGSGRQDVNIAYFLEKFPPG